MIIFVNEAHRLHEGRVEMFRGTLVPCFEVAARVECIRAELVARGIGPIGPAPEAPDAVLAGIHSTRYLAFLRTAWDEWVGLDPANAGRDMLGSVWPAHGLRRDVDCDSLAARVGQFSFDAGTPLTSGTWRAARRGADCAIAAVEAVRGGAGAAFALTRPPGHHAGPDFYGGYCFINQAAVAAQALRDGGAGRVAIVDIDYHHGNGSQAIFYERGDVFQVSVHGDPRTEYPFYLGYPDETGRGAGEGFNLNLPLPRGTGFRDWMRALARALDAVSAYRADAMVVSLGVDTFEGDPISGFRLRSGDYFRVGEALAGCRLPTVFVLEGGYAVDAIGALVANVLEGFDGARS